MKQWQSLMASEEKRAGLPVGTLASLVQQETGGQKRFIDNPADFHYKVGPNGEKPKSTARGLGGILASTARDPGYGVAPLKDWSAPEQLRFMADYTKARIKQAGSVEGGLAGYGEGTKYAQQVVSRLPKEAPVVQAQAMPQAAPMAPATVIANAPVPAPTFVNTEAPMPAVASLNTMLAQAEPTPMAAMDQVMPRPRMVANDLAFNAPEELVMPEVPKVNMAWANSKNNNAAAKQAFMKSLFPSLVT